MITKTKVKVCCIKNLEEANLALKYGADALGLVSEMPSGPGVISEDEIAFISVNIPNDIDSFLLTSRQSAKEIIKQHKRCKTKTIQLTDKIPNEDYNELKRSLPAIKIIQVIHVINEESIQEALEILKNVDGLLLDSGNPNLSIKELGGTGRIHNWEISKKIVELSEKPVFLAGGLNPLNVVSAIKTVKPFGVDICSGLRKNGILDENLLKDFMNNVKSV
jgi:phosphoribosylanthranilate isomerase